MSIHLLLFGDSTKQAPPNEFLDGAIVVVDEVANQVTVTISARQVAVVDNHSYVSVVDSDPRPVARVDEVEPSIVVVTKVLPLVARILPPDEPRVVVTENTSAAETR